MAPPVDSAHGLLAAFFGTLDALAPDKDAKAARLETAKGDVIESMSAASLPATTADCANRSATSRLHKSGGTNILLWKRQPWWRNPEQSRSRRGGIMRKHRYPSLLLAMAITFRLAIPSGACTRAEYHGLDDLNITGRTMDWKEPIPASLWILPRGIHHDGRAGSHSVQWTSKYGSVVVSAFGIASADGMNEKGLVTNMLWLPGSQYPEPEHPDNRLSISLWVQYFLDNFATVNEAVQAMQEHPLQVVSDRIPGTKIYTTVHLSISDASGDNAILEYIDGKLIIHHSRDDQVMTNEPAYDQQLALASYWNQVGGTVFLPGTNRSADRFARASFYIHAIPKTANAAEGVAEVMSVMRNVSVPIGISTPDKPNISNTRWRVVADQKHLKYYYDAVTAPNTFWVDLKKADFQVGAPVLRLPLEANEIYSGDALKDFKPSKLFQFLPVLPKE
ncbi:linear amide C-N hydrolase [Methylacidimicrobium tartarophylax]